MKYIQSSSNNLYKDLVKIASNKNKNYALLEGEHLCEMYLSNALPLKVIYKQKNNTLPAVKKLIDAIPEAQHIILKDSLYKQLTDLPSLPPVMYLINVPEKQLDFKCHDNILILDRIQDPGNLGTIFRTALAANIQHIILSKGCANPYSQKVLRSAQGAHFFLSLYYQQDLKKIIPHLHIPIYATALNTESINLYQLNLRKKCAWILGNEGQGIDHELLKIVDQTVFIPQGAAVESLNVGVACGVVLFEQLRQQNY